MSDSDHGSDPELIALLGRHCSDDVIIELAALIAYRNMSSKFNAARGVPAQGFCASAQPVEEGR